MNVNEQLIASSPLAWIMLNKMVTENQIPIEFDDHRFLIDLYADMHDDIVVIKSAQVGESTERILKCIWCAKYLKANIIYVLPTKNISDDFVVPKVNPIIASNPAINELVKNDSKGLKQVGDRFIYFSGAFSESAAIMKSADILVLDELDRMKDTNIVNMFDSRLQFSKLAYKWRLSNPSQVGFGVDALFKNSDQRHWFIKHSCGYERFIDFEQDQTPEEGPMHGWHYVDKEREIYACGACGEEVTDQERRMGRWVTRFPKVHRHGYWISQMMAPWVSAKRILEQYEESTTEFFYNFVLGKAYTPSDMIVNRETILRACAPSIIPKVNVSIGVDQKASEMEWVAGTTQGIFAHGKAKSWDEIEDLKLMYNAVVVSDPMPYGTIPKIMAQKYNDWYLCYFKESKGLEILQWKDQVVYADRTRLLDLVANEITSSRLLFREHPNQLEDIIADWLNIYRTTVEEPDGRQKSTWLKKDNKESDYPFSLAYYRIGLTKLLNGDSELLDPSNEQPGNRSYEVGQPASFDDVLGGAISETFADMD